MGNDEAVENIERQRVIDVDAATEDIEVDDRSFPVIDEGKGPTVMLFHGFPDSRRLWRYQVPALVDAGFRVVAPDLRGFGDAPKPQEVEAYELPTIVEDDVLGLMDALDIEQTRVVGHDWGAHVAWTTAVTVPDRVEQVAVLSSGSPGNSAYHSSDQMSAFWHIYYFQFDAAEPRLRHDDWQLFRDWCEGGDDVERYVEELSRPGALTAGLNWYRANVRPQPPEEDADLPDLTCPVMGVLPEDDAYLNAPQMKRSTENIDLTEGSWRYETIADSGHWVPVDAPVEVNRLLVDFLDR